MATTTTLILSTALSLLVYKMVTWYLRYRKWAAQYDSLPGTNGHWFFGHIKEIPNLKQEGLDYMYSKVQQYPRMQKFWTGWMQCTIAMYHPDTTKHILKCPAKEAPKPRALGTVYRLGLPWLGEGLLLANGGRWARNRRLLTPGFHFDVLQPYVPVFNATVEVFLGKLADFAEREETFDLYKHVGLLSLDNMLRCALSYSSDCQLVENHPYVMAVKRLSDLWCDRTLYFLHLFDWFYFNFTKNGREFLKLCDFVHQFSDGIINKRKQELKNIPRASKDVKEDMEQTKSHYLDFLDILLTAEDEEGHGLSDLDIRAEVDTFLFEGHDTISSGTSFILMELARHPEIQRRVQAEIDEIVRSNGSEGILWRDLSRLEYLSLCIKEGMRMNPPVFYIQRAVEEEVVVDGYRIPKGTSVIIHFRNLHHNPEVWGEDHWEFKPERFLPENVDSRDPFAFAPFSGGQRNCIGQHFAMNEMKVIIARILHRYTLTLDPSFVDRKMMSVVMRPEHGIQMRAKKRNVIGYR